MRGIVGPVHRDSVMQPRTLMATIVTKFHVNKGVVGAYLADTTSSRRDDETCLMESV